MPVSEQLEQQVRQLAASSLAGYVKTDWPDYDLSLHHQELIRALHAVIDKQLDRLLVLMPPRHGKSTLTSVYFPAYYLGRFPDREIVCAAYSQDLANDFGRQVRNLVASPQHQAIFPKSIISPDSTARSKFNMTEGGVYIAAGVGGPVTGRGADILLIDDPVKDREAAYSEIEQRTVFAWYQSVAYTRLQKGSAIVITMTPWSVGDLAGRVQEQELELDTYEGWYVLRLPALAEPDDPLGRVPGAALWPDRFPEQALQRIKNAVGPETWLSLYQCRPAEAQGNVFKRSWLQYYDTINKSDFNIYIVVDPATSKRVSADYTAMWVVGFGPDNNIYVLDCIRDRLTLAERADALFKLWETWRPNRVGYEQYGLQSDIAYIKERQEKINRRFSIDPMGGQLKKAERIRGLIPWFRDGRIWFPKTLPYIELLGKHRDMMEVFVEQEYTTYPACRHDDLLDSLARVVGADLSTTWPVQQHGSASDIYDIQLGRSWEGA
jgi:predicted phage terminase large subunit-like protein